MEAQIGGIYRHYKGQLYRVLNIARHSETLEAMIVYEALYSNPSGQIWVRPESMFLEFVKNEGKTIARFAKIATTLSLGAVLAWIVAPAGGGLVAGGVHVADRLF